MSREVIAVDFDGCIVTNNYPEIGKPDPWVVRSLKERQMNGSGIILWTCREGEKLQEAVDYCKNELGLVFDAVNRNLPSYQFSGDSRKVWATEYWDDRSVTVRAGSRHVGPMARRYR